jgi:hypothetical protein
VLIVLKSGSLNLLEPSGPVKVCNGIALPLPLPLPLHLHYITATHVNKMLHTECVVMQQHILHSGMFHGT